MRSEQNDFNPLLTIPRAAKQCGIGRRQVMDAIRRGELACYQVGGWRRVRWADVLHWIERQRIFTGGRTPHDRQETDEQPDTDWGTGPR